MRGFHSPTTATLGSLLLAVLAASSTCFLCLVPANPAQSQGMPPRQSGSPPEGPYVGNVAPDEQMVMLVLLRVVTNSHINVRVESGDRHPNRMAVQVVPYGRGQPDWSQAKWMAYSSNVDLDLGESDGKKMAYIKGEWDDGHVTVMGVPITLVRSSPVIAVTNPPSLLTAQPMIQLQGYSDRPLAGIRFDVVNERGAYTVRDGQGIVTDQYFDRNSFESTTNYFTCFDIDLSRGTNTIVLRCTDGAGNTTTTNLHYVFTTLGHTNPPVITLDYPTNGEPLVGSEFLIRGYLSDPTATVMGLGHRSAGPNPGAGRVGGKGWQILARTYSRAGRHWLCVLDCLRRCHKFLRDEFYDSPEPQRLEA